MLSITRRLRKFGLTASLIAIVAAAAAGGVAPPTESQDFHTTSSADPIGNIAWEITETSSGKILGKGKRNLVLSDVQVIADGKPGGYIEQRIPLSAGFYVKLNAGRSPESITGFGMAAGKEDMTTFSWEWFVVNEPGNAEKLQETGELNFESTKIGDFIEITQTQFLTDISMRVLDFEENTNGDTRKPRWRVKIMKGSDVRWPTFAGGKVMLGQQAVQWQKAHPRPLSFWESLVSAAGEDSTSSSKSTK